MRYRPAANDAGGHDTGDRLLRLVAARLGTTLDGMGVKIARLGGDEFVLYLEMLLNKTG